ncbi:MAG: hypothetical protein QM820_03450 [Minicystis sp.]
MKKSCATCCWISVVPLEAEALAVLGLQVRIGRLLAEFVERRLEVAVVQEQRVARLGVLVEALGQEHGGAEEHVAAPELREQLAPHADVLDVPRVLRRLDRRDLLIEREAHDVARGRIDLQLHGLRDQVAGRLVPFLALAAVHRQLHHVAVGAMEGLVTVEDGLHEVLARREVREARDREAERRAVDDRGRAGREPIGVDAEDLLGLEPLLHLKARLGLAGLREDDDHAAVERRRRARGRKRDLDAHARLGPAGGAVCARVPGRPVRGRRRRRGGAAATTRDRQRRQRRTDLENLSPVHRRPLVHRAPGSLPPRAPHAAPRVHDSHVISGTWKNIARPVDRPPACASCP